ncbi:MAG: hypothetical protein ACOZF0_23140 [Thermodesulfobacteriota bacterium]
MQDSPATADRIPIAVFISPHGFGHASRAAAVMEALGDACRNVHPHIFTTVPEWFFSESLGSAYTYHHCLTDIGLVQTNPLEENLPETIRRLEGFFPFRDSQWEHLCQLIARIGCRMIIADISPLAIHISRQTGIPSMLIENFTWDWIYFPYAQQFQEFGLYIQYLRQIFRQADFHVQTDPLCERHPETLHAAPISRKVKTPRQEIRRRLDIPEKQPAVLITMGGVKGGINCLAGLTRRSDIVFILPGDDHPAARTANVIRLPHHSGFFHPDLVHAVDAVIGKAGYSTIAEIYHAGIPFGYVTRPNFRESEKLADFIAATMPGFPVTAAEFHCGDWLSRLDHLLCLPRFPTTRRNGSHQVAQYIIHRLGDTCEESDTP